MPKLGLATAKADDGEYLTLCSNCGGAYPSAAVLEASITPESKWTLVRVGKQIALKGSNGNYLSRCNGCWSGGAYPDSAFVHLNNDSEPYSKWTPEKQANGKWALKGDNGKYLARCNACAPSTVENIAFVH